jgi:flavin reductase (DIM6/NTAB) family NADH-FMN oxidoreductase RutF
MFYSIQRKLYEKVFMLESEYQIKPAVPWFPAGLISWYAPDDTPVALVTSWVALIGGDGPCIRMAWHGQYGTLSRLWKGGDFVFNLPSEPGLQIIRDLMAQGKLCLDARVDLQQACLRGVSAAAPRLTECTVQIECVGGALLDSGYDTDLRGEVVHLHKGPVSMAVAEIKDLCALQPLNPWACE